jgi:hypothetical protein
LYKHGLFQHGTCQYPSRRCRPGLSGLSLVDAVPDFGGQQGLIRNAAVKPPGPSAPSPNPGRDSSAPGRSPGRRGGDSSHRDGGGQPLNLNHDARRPRAQPASAAAGCRRLPVAGQRGATGGIDSNSAHLPLPNCRDSYFQARRT